MSSSHKTDLANHMDSARNSIFQASQGILNGDGTPVQERSPFVIFTRMITPDDVLAVTSERDVNTIVRGLHGWLKGMRQMMEYAEKYRTDDVSSDT